MKKILVLIILVFLLANSGKVALASDYWWVAGGYYVCSTQGSCDAHFTIFDSDENPIGSYAVPPGESYLVPPNHTAYVGLSCGPSSCRPPWPAGHVIAPAVECPCDADVTVYDAAEQQTDSFTVHAGDSYIVPDDHTARECLVCGFCPPPPTPTPVPNAAEECNSIVLTETLVPGYESWIDIQPCANCVEATVECSSIDAVRVYGNGLFLGECGNELSPFYTRGALSSTLTLLNTGDVTTTAHLTISCDVVLGGAGGNPLPTPTIWLLPTPTVAIEYQGQSGDPPSPPDDPSPLLGLDFGGDPTDPNSPVGKWLGYGKDTIGLVNRGNLLYIMGGILTATMVLSWAINEVKNPKSW